MGSVKLTAAALAAGATFFAYSAQAEGTLNLICSADVVICEQMEGAFEKETGISVNMVRLSSGETYAKIRAEARNPKTDIWWAGTGDPHLQAASEGLTLEYKSQMLGELQDWAVKQAESAGYRTVGVYAGALGWGYNTEIFKQ
ncbi:MAG TPA: extracellular solute-binding protein, partial [Sinorhizobium sp.]|nr:extracellular solute-binding protein [Sinorhizobium sp.]